MGHLSVDNVLELQGEKRRWGSCYPSSLDSDTHSSPNKRCAQTQTRELQHHSSGVIHVGCCFFGGGIDLNPSERSAVYLLIPPSF